MDLVSEDVEIISEGVATSFHKLILALHSSYFRTLFSNTSFQEKDQNVIKTSSFKPKIIKTIKIFFYTGRINVTRKTIRNVLEAFTFYMIEDMFGKLEDAMMTFFNNDNMPDSYEVQLWEDYCCINSLWRCCSDCTFTNSFETLCISWIKGAISLHYLPSVCSVPAVTVAEHTWRLVACPAAQPCPAMAPFPRRKWVYYTWAGGRWDLAWSWAQAQCEVYLMLC